MTIAFFILAILFQGIAVIYSVWMAVVTKRLSAWLLLSLGFGVMLGFRVFRITSFVVHDTPHDISDGIGAALISALLLLAMILIKKVYDDRNTTENKLRENENRYRSVVTAMSEGILIADHSGIKNCNPAALRILGFTQEQLLQRSLTDPLWNAIHEDGTPVPSDSGPATGTLKTGIARQNVILRLDRPDGSQVWLSANSEPLAFNVEGSTQSVVVSFSDITARKQAEDALIAAKNAAEKANAAKDQFLAVLSHELRTPLTPVLATVEALAADTALPAIFQQDVQLIRRNVELEARLIDDLLDLTRISKGKTQLNIAPVNLHEMVQHVLQICHPDIAGKNLQVDVYLAAEKHTVPGDSARLQQVLWNLLKNAIKFTPDHGRITLRSATCTSHEKPATIKLEISDTGVGIDPAALPHLFNAFQQASPAIARQYGGLGLGLAITKALVNLHHGSVTASSAGPNHGATFLIELPLLASAHIAPHAAPPTPYKIRPLAILLVEDHLDSSRTMTRLLTSLGHSVHAAATVQDGLRAAAAAHFDLILSDIGLPDGSGHDFLQQLRQTQSIPAIALSGFGMEEDIAKSKNAGFAAHLTKPITFQSLERAIHEIIANRPDPASPAPVPVWRCPNLNPSLRDVSLTTPHHPPPTL